MCIANSRFPDFAEGNARALSTDAVQGGLGTNAGGTTQTNEPRHVTSFTVLERINRDQENQVQQSSLRARRSAGATFEQRTDQQEERFSRTRLYAFGHRRPGGDTAKRKT